MTNENIQPSLTNELEHELKAILDFWMNQTPDSTYGGFIGEMEQEGNKNNTADKGGVLTARILWTFSAAYIFFKEPGYLEVAHRAYHYLIKHFWDDKNGGLYWAVNYKGEAVNVRKQAYAQGFGIYGLSEYYKASDNQESLNYAIKLFGLIEQHYKDEQYGGYIEALADNWQPLEDMRLSEKDANEPKSMNTHLHIIEPYTNLYCVWPDETLRSRIQHLITIFRDRIIDPQTFHFNLFFDMDWSPKSDIISYGHDIEGAWLLTEAAHFIHDEELLAQMQKMAVKMVDATIADGFDKDGSLFYEQENGHLDSDKHWWPQAEGMVGLMEVYQITGNEKYFTAMMNLWEFIKGNIIDKKYGEWYWKVDRNGCPDSVPPKVGFWKCPYHNSRALMELITRIKSIN
ncbi:AGE family epimerase/isomerase [Carboxylicivirga sediminis]|uniref:Cellobiose 2-epimerase n=1 Tax=Carboxylicivirga sediminis TaxID=2006564 RepID=A0A941IWY1_9BACT|nr:AGE family epimerase/isomerase [Carboxylicivirga sediminis]MBR8534057.1 AGE family epimerase/isomerase [Carboxylicivirga sediminis]